MLTFGYVLMNLFFGRSFGRFIGRFDYRLYGRARLLSGRVLGADREQAFLPGLGHAVRGAKSKKGSVCDGPVLVDT
jgi:hypothetical protein